MSFYSDYFPSELVLRLWDIQIFQFSQKDKRERKFGLWYLLAPAYLILTDQSVGILNAKTFDEIWQAFRAGRTSSAYTAHISTFGDRLYSVCKELFVSGEGQ